MTIDLGDVSAPPPNGSRSTRSAAGRPLTLLAVVLVALTLGGSVASAPGLRPVLVTEELPGAFELSRSALYTTGYVSARGQVRRYPLAGGSPGWSVQLPQPVGNIALVAAAGVLLVTSPESLQVSVLDSETGAVLWRRTSGATYVLRTTGDSALLTSPAGVGGGIVIERVGLRTGLTRWTRRLAAGGYLDAGNPAGEEPSPIVTVDREGRAAILNFTDGTVLRTAQLGTGSEPSRQGDRLYLTRSAGGAGSLTAYRLSDLQPEWHSTTTSFGWPNACGPYLCLSTATGMTVVDAVTGAEGWSTTQWRLGIDSRALGIPGPFRLMVSDARHTLRDAMLDPGTGQVLLELGDSVLVGPTVVRVDTVRSGRIWVQRFGVGGELRAVGAIDGESLEGCAAEGEYLACVTRRGRATVWRMKLNR